MKYGVYSIDTQLGVDLEAKTNSFDMAVKMACALCEEPKKIGFVIDLQAGEVVKETANWKLLDKIKAERTE